MEEEPSKSRKIPAIAGDKGGTAQGLGEATVPEITGDGTIEMQQLQCNCQVRM